MVERGLESFFEVFLRKESVFFDKRAIQSTYIPETIHHREEQTKQIANILAPALKGDKPSNIFIYGKTGTGKTLTTKHTIQKLMGVAQKQNIPLKVIYLNCKLKRSTDTEYRLVAQLARELGKSIPPTGLPTEEVYRIFFKAIKTQRQNYIFVLDEIDQLVNKTGDNALYNLTRINEEETESQISIIGISNDVMFVDNLDPRVKSSLSEEEVVFPPYNAFQIQSILKQRSELAFNKDVLDHGVVEKCAAYAARDHGDARRAFELLRVAGEVADRKNNKKITIEHIDEAEEKIDRDRVIDVVITQPKQYQLVLYSILSIKSNKKNNIFTGEVYEIYKTLCNKTNTTILTQRRVSDIISEFDMLGIVNAKVISKGRYGRTRDIAIGVPENTLPRIKKILEENMNF
jgi:cell division control protein 6|tara:strand:- start:13376 stop:14584 length:1209 start_codon:yes stop_codon:yes gene_type:complete